jgi:hypothetical protein
MPASSNAFPSFPPELLLEILSHAETASLSALCSVCIIVLELVLLFQYDNIDAKALSFTAPIDASPTLAHHLLPEIALSSIRTLPVTAVLSYPRPPLLPNLRYLHTHTLPHSDAFLPRTPFLSSLNPTSLTFHPTPPSTCSSSAHPPRPRPTQRETLNQVSRSHATSPSCET